MEGNVTAINATGSALQEGEEEEEEEEEEVKTS